jgi:hypothetical protein
MTLFIGILISVLLGFGAGYTWGRKVSDYKTSKELDKILEMMKR